MNKACRSENLNGSREGSTLTSLLDIHFKNWFDLKLILSEKRHAFRFDWMDEAIESIQYNGIQSTNLIPSRFSNHLVPVQVIRSWIYIILSYSSSIKLSINLAIVVQILLLRSVFEECSNLSSCSFFFMQRLKYYSNKLVDRVTYWLLNLYMEN